MAPLSHAKRVSFSDLLAHSNHEIALAIHNAAALLMQELTLLGHKEQKAVCMRKPHPVARG
jgi:hypothetical protein